MAHHEHLLSDVSLEKKTHQDFIQSTEEKANKQVMLYVKWLDDNQK